MDRRRMCDKRKTLWNWTISAVNTFLMKKYMERKRREPMTQRPQIAGNTTKEMFCFSMNRLAAASNLTKAWSQFEPHGNSVIHHDSQGLLATSMMPGTMDLRSSSGIKTIKYPGNSPQSTISNGGRFGSFLTRCGFAAWTLPAWTLPGKFRFMPILRTCFGMSAQF